MLDYLKLSDTIYCNSCSHEAEAMELLLESENAEKYEGLNCRGLLMAKLKCGKCGSRNFKIRVENFTYYVGCGN
jgi:uncharacterized Zn finger protein